MQSHIDAQQIEHEDKNSEEHFPEYLEQHFEMEGRTVYQKGLDYSLLKEQQEKELLRNQEKQTAKLKIKYLTQKYQQKYQNTINPERSDPKNTQMACRILGVYRTKPTNFHNTYYLFDLNYEFGSQAPNILIKRQSKYQATEEFVDITRQKISAFNQLLHRKQNQPANKQAIVQEDSDNIFDDDEEDVCQKQKEVQKDEPIGSKEKVRSQDKIQVGRRLNFGLEDNLDIFKRRYKPEPLAEPQREDKYSFMHKKVNRNADSIEGYDECYYNSGYSLQEMKDLRNRGIEVYGTQRQFKQKQRKVDIGKDYEKIKKIIKQKQK